MWPSQTPSPPWPVPAAIPAMAAPANWAVIDIETSNGRPEDAEREMRLLWSPASSWKPATIGERWLAALQKKNERLALLATAPIICVSVRTSGGETHCWHHMQQHPLKAYSAAMVEGHTDQAAMLRSLRAWLDVRVGPDTILSGHNIRAFDLPRLRCAYVRAGLRLPTCLAAFDLAVYDTMERAAKMFGADSAFISLADTCELLGLGHHKEVVTGAEVPQLYEAGQFEAIVTYCILDVLAEADLFCQMAGLADDMVRAPSI